VEKSDTRRRGLAARIVAGVPRRGGERGDNREKQRGEQLGRAEKSKRGRDHKRKEPPLEGARVE
jgi:hypothetical protein